jgi:peptidoglycan/LPS O-acetylase OafA/YrhL
VTTPTRDDARLGWLDALRGFAALTVAWFHLSPQMIGTERHLALFRHLDLGKYGVLLFFLVSGYVIPMSLERHGSLRRFWVGRLFRIYPAYLLSAGLTLALVAAGRTGLPLSLRQETVTGVLGHATMMTDFLGVRGVVRVFWTLSYEMTFYLIVAGLFVWRLHRFSPWWAVGLTLTSVLGGRALPDGLFASTVADRRITAAVLVVLVGGSVAAYLSGRRRLALGAGAIGLFFVLLPVLNGSPTKWSTAAGSWQALLLLAVMFAGTVVYRVQHGQVSRWAAAIALCAVALALSGTAWLRTSSGRPTRRRWRARSRSRSRCAAAACRGHSRGWERSVFRSMCCIRLCCSSSVASSRSRPIDRSPPRSASDCCSPWSRSCCPGCRTGSWNYPGRPWVGGCSG